MNCENFTPKDKRNNENDPSGGGLSFVQMHSDQTTGEVVLVLGAGVTATIPIALHLVETRVMTTMTTTMGMTVHATTKATQ